VDVVHAAELRATRAHPVVVSHARRCLNRICEHIIAFDGDWQSTMHPGNRSVYETGMREKFGNCFAPQGVKHPTPKR
jgi:ATPase subunit of ABC transporter with duplicated ATPase domains